MDPLKTLYTSAFAQRVLASPNLGPARRTPALRKPQPQRSSAALVPPSFVVDFGFRVEG